MSHAAKVYIFVANILSMQQHKVDKQNNELSRYQCNSFMNNSSTSSHCILIVKPLNNVALFFYFVEIEFQLCFCFLTFIGDYLLEL